MSIVIVAFEGAPKVSEEAKEKEAELDSRLEVKVKGASNLSFDSICHISNLLAVCGKVNIIGLITPAMEVMCYLYLFVCLSC